MSNDVSGLLSELHSVLLDAPTIQARVAAMAAQIERDLHGHDLTVIALMDGSLFFVADLLRHLDLPMRIVTINASSYNGTTQSCGSVRLPWPTALDLTGKHVLLLDDILDTGLTLAAVLERLSLEKTASVHSAVLLKKRREQVREVAIDYVGFEIEDEFVVGYGMDYNGKFRNLPCIGTLKLGA